MAKDLTHKKTLENFKEWLVGRGAEILPPTSEYEVLRFRANAVTSIVYKNGAGNISYYANEAKKAYRAFRGDGEYKTDARKTKKRLKSSKKEQRKEAVRERDGNDCFFCGEVVPKQDQTVEHLLSLAHGGNHHLSNLALSCASCNYLASHMSLVEKIKLREEKRGAVSNGKA